MIRFLILLCFALMYLSASSLAKEKWETFVNEDFNFSIDFYGEPEKTSQENYIFERNITSYAWFVETKDTAHPNTIYQISFMECPIEIIHSDSSNVMQFLMGSQSHFANNSNLELLTSSTIDELGYPAIIFNWNIKSTKQNIISKAIMVENKLFQLFVFTKSNHQFNLDSDKFFKSFKLNGVPKGNFQLIEAKEDTYKINFPNEPTEKIENIILNGQTIPFKTLMYTNEYTKNKLYMAFQIHYPEIFDFPQDQEGLELMYENTIAGSIKTLNGELISTTDITVNGITGKEARVAILNGTHLGVFRYYLENNSCYASGVVTRSEFDNNKKLLEFLDSFEIIKDKE